MQIHVEQTSQLAGAVAGRAVARIVEAAIEARGSARVIFASAPSQAEMLAGLGESGIDLSRVEAFHLDEYLGIDPEHPAGFGKWLVDRLALNLHRLDSLADPDKEIMRYSRLLRQAPIDLACVGIGVNGHLAFNEPNDVASPGTLVRAVALTAASRQQQVDDACFSALDDVPTHALSLTPEAILSAASIVCTVSGARKADAVAAAIEGPVSPACPASALQQHPDLVMVLDDDAAARLDRRG